jgi:hypothetical protein
MFEAITILTKKHEEWVQDCYNSEVQADEGYETKIPALMSLETPRS